MALRFLNSNFVSLPHERAGLKPRFASAGRPRGVCIPRGSGHGNDRKGTTMKTTTMKFVAAAAVAMGVSGIAHADTISGAFTTSHGQQINITSPTLNGNVNTVKFNWTRSDTPGAGIDASIATSFNSYCVDLAQVVSANTNYTFNVVSPMEHGFSADQTMLLERLWADYFPTIDSAEKSAAFQMSIWEIIHDPTFSLSSGVFKVNNAAPAAALASSWLSNVSSVSYSTVNAMPQLVVLQSPTAQDQITVIPAPATGALACMGLIALASRRRHS